MSKIYTALYSDSGPGVAAGAPKSGVYPAISIAAGNLRSVRVPFFSEGNVTQLAVKQTSGVSVDFNVELLCSSIPFPTGEALVATPPAGTVELYRIVPPQSGVAGGSVELVPDNEYGWTFRNVDGDHTLNQRYIYLVIKPVGAAGATEWDAMVIGYSNN